MAERDQSADIERLSALLRALVDNVPSMLAYWDTDQRCRFANRAYEKWFGVTPEQLVGRHMRDLLGPLYALNLPHIEGALRGEEQEFERTIPDPAGGPARHSHALYIPHVVDGTIRGFCVLVTDISSRKRAEDALIRMERQLQASERLASLATLAAGIAHEINNPLASVLVNLDATLSELDAGTAELGSLRTTLAEARDGTTRVARIVESMKLLARGDTTRRELVDVNLALDKSVELTANVIRYRARVVRDLKEVGRIDANPSQLCDVFVNLLVNAAHALPEKTTRRNEIRISTRRDGEHVVVEIADNGCGIPAELQSRIFEPFFTTKDVGEGMGLGLSLSSSVVATFGGKISVRSAPGQGSVFELVFPAARAPEVQAMPSAAPKPPRRTPIPGEGLGTRLRVLVVDDEALLAKTLQRLLGHDFDVDVLHHGREAIARLVENDDRYDVILCDLMMPEVTGPDVYAAVTTKRPELAEQFIFMTGGAFTPRGREFLDDVKAPIIEKPFDLGKLRALLHARAARRPAE